MNERTAKSFRPESSLVMLSFANGGNLVLHQVLPSLFPGLYKDPTLFGDSAKNQLKPQKTGPDAAQCWALHRVFGLRVHLPFGKEHG